MVNEDHSINLGPEYDKELFCCVVDVLKAMGARVEGDTWGVGGSQELATVRFQLRGMHLILEVETYMGMTLIGDPAVIAEVAEQVRARRGR